MLMFLVFAGAAVLLWLLFFWNVVRERRQLRNGIYLSMALGSSYLAVLLLPGLPYSLRVILGLGGLVLIALFSFFVCIFLIVNGLVMLRREGRSLSNTLSLLTGLGLLLASSVWGRSTHTTLR